MNSLVPFPKSRKQQCRLLPHRIDVRFGSKADMRLPHAMSAFPRKQTFRSALGFLLIRIPLLSSRLTIE